MQDTPPRRRLVALVLVRCPILDSLAYIRIAWDGGEHMFRVVECPLSIGAVLCGTRCRMKAVPSSLKLQLTVYRDGIAHQYHSGERRARDLFSTLTAVSSS